MFGYIKPNAGELRVKEYELYKAVYCGLCRTGGKRVSHLTRLLLSYDFVFLAMLRFCFTGEKLTVHPERCPCFPLRKRPAVGECETLVYCASVFAVLTYYKYCDCIHDEKGFKKLGALLMRVLCKPMKKKALKRYGGLDETIALPLGELVELEKNGESCLDKAADCFARMLAGAASFGFEGADKRILFECGYHTGRFIYIADACDDLEDDAKKGRYNALMAAAGNIQAAREMISDCETSLKDSMNALLLSFSLAGGGDAAVTLIHSIIENIAGYSAGVFIKTKDIAKKKG